MKELREVDIAEAKERLEYWKKRREEVQKLINQVEAKPDNDPSKGDMMFGLLNTLAEIEGHILELMTKYNL